VPLFGGSVGSVGIVVLEAGGDGYEVGWWLQPALQEVTVNVEVVKEVTTAVPEVYVTGQTVVVVKDVKTSVELGYGVVL
jgi:hypothetical protein